MTPERRAQIVETIDRWLASWPDSEPLPAGLDPTLVESGHDPPNLVTLAAAVTRVSRELHLQGKSFERVHEGWTVGAVDGEALKEAIRAVETSTAAKLERIENEFRGLESSATASRRSEAIQGELDELRQLVEQSCELQRREAERYEVRLRERDDVLLDLLEVRDRVERVRDEIGRATGRLSRFARWGGAPAILDGIGDGVHLIVERIEEVLARANVRRFESTGRAFDPENMRAIDREPAGADTPSDTVTVTLSAGYLRGQELLRPAEVRVAR